MEMMEFGNALLPCCLEAGDKRINIPASNILSLHISPSSPALLTKKIGSIYVTKNHSAPLHMNWSQKIKDKKKQRSNEG